MRPRALTALPLAAAAAVLGLGGRPLHAEPAPPPLEVTGSAFAARLRDRVAERLQRGPAHPRWFDAGAAPPEVVRAPRFLYVRDRALSLPAPPWFGDDAYAAAFELVRDAWAGAEPEGARVLVVFTTFDDGGGSLFYLPLANDVAGLGEGKPTELFDDTPSSALEGVAWLGAVDRLEAAGEDYLREAFIHELAHRWVAYASVAHEVLPRDALRGRQRMHWSFLSSTGASPMEGNDWTVEPDGAWVAAVPRPLRFRFSPLDLYLMGVLPPEDVPPFALVTRWSVLAPAGLEVKAETAPAHRLGAPVRLAVADHAMITIEEVIAGSGPRRPGASDEPVTWPVGVVLLSNGLSPASFEALEHLDRRLEGLATDFSEATGGRMRLDLAVPGAGRLAPGAPCADVDACDRTRADRCVPIGAGGPSVCARSCRGDADCDPDACCGAAGREVPPPSPGAATVCLPRAACVDAQGARAPLEAPEESEPSASVVGDAALTPTGCACVGARTAAPTAALGAVAALSAAACLRGRARRVRPAGARRGSRGSPG